MATALATRTVQLIQKVCKPGVATEFIAQMNNQAGGSVTVALTDECTRGLWKSGMPLSVVNDFKKWISASTASNVAVTVATSAASTDSATIIAIGNGHDAKLIKALNVWLQDWDGTSADIIQALGG